MRRIPLVDTLCRHPCTLLELPLHDATPFDVIHNELMNRHERESTLSNITNSPSATTPHTNHIEGTRHVASHNPIPNIPLTRAPNFRSLASLLSTLARLPQQQQPSHFQTLPLPRQESGFHAQKTRIMHTFTRNESLLPRFPTASSVPTMLRPPRTGQSTLATPRPQSGVAAWQ